MMPLGAPSISKYGSLVRPDAQIVALRAHYARTALEAPPSTIIFAPSPSFGCPCSSTCLTSAPHGMKHPLTKSRCSPFLFQYTANAVSTSSCDMPSPDLTASASSVPSRISCSAMSSSKLSVSSATFSVCPLLLMNDRKGPFTQRAHVATVRSLASRSSASPGLF